MAGALQDLIDQVQAARASKTMLEIRGDASKLWYGEAAQGEVLDVTPLAGISSYEPTELVVTARAGTRLAELESALAEKGQWLPFEPPRFGGGGTVGGMVAAGIAGPGRAAFGSVRDYVLGATLLNGRAEVLSFGGQVMKNVAGYDVSRLLAGSLGVLGVICEVSLKVLPRPPALRTLRYECDEAGALKRLNEWAGLPLPLSASAWWEGTLVLRLAGATAAVQAAHDKLGGEPIEAALADGFWSGLRDHSDEFFGGAALAVEGGASLWRLSLPQTAPPLKLSGEQLIEWGGAQRWLCTTTPATQVRDLAAGAGGHATLFRSRDKSGGVFAPLQPPLDRIHRQLKAAFDPDGLFNRGRLYPDLSTVLDYYRRRAASYERIYQKPERQADLRAIEAWLATPLRSRHVLEIACGTGWWTPFGARDAASWLATDLNPETMDLARAKPMPACVSFETVDADTFDALGERRFDAAFHGCWWSHVSLARLPAWNALLHQRLDRGARVVVLDNRYVEGSSTPISRPDAAGNSYQQRTLDDGSTHEVLKNFPTRAEALAALGPRARTAEWTEYAHYWTLSYTLA